jgi:hypothetical protein
MEGWQELSDWRMKLDVQVKTYRNVCPVYFIHPADTYLPHQTHSLTREMKSFYSVIPF